MDLHTVTDLMQLQPGTELPQWAHGDAWLAGGSALFAEPQVGLSRLLDVTGLGWPALRADHRGLEIAGTCTVTELAEFDPPSHWPAAALIAACCSCFVASFKVRGVATVGGNIVCALPAGPMTSLAASLGGIATIWGADQSERLVAVEDLVIGAGRTSLRPGDLLRSVLLPDSALRSRHAFRRISLTTYGRTAALLIGLSAQSGVTLTITGATVRPIVLTLPGVLTPAELTIIIDGAIPDSLWHNDVHGSPSWRRAQTHRLAQEIHAELQETEL